MNTTLITIVGLLLLCVTSGCGSSNEDHNAGIGKTYSFASFTLTSPTGATFALNPDELDSLERVWFNAQIASEIDICNKIQQAGTKLQYKFVLDDGFTANFDANYGTVNGSSYLNIFLLGDGGGFPGDVYWELVSVDSVFSKKRLSELELWLEAEN